MAKMVVKTMPTNAYATIRPFFDEIAEDCSFLEVSNDETTPTTLILTIDTDLVFSLGQYSNPRNNIGPTSTYFNGISIQSSASSISTYDNPRYIVLYSDTLFLFCLRTTYDNSQRFSLIYEKVGNDKFAYSYTGQFSEMVPLKTTDGSNISRLPTLNYNISENGYIDYIDRTSLLLNGARYAQVDTNLISCSKHNSIAQVLTMNNHDYYALTQYILIPIDPE